MEWIIVSLLILGLIVLLCFIFFKRARRREPNYRALFFVGILWLAIGLPSGNETLTMLGIVFAAAGIVNRKRWGRKRRWKKLSKKEQRMRMTAMAVTGAVVAVLFLLIILKEIAVF
jgi:NhaP-type Na+/H+ or K+/H+ antiporter